MSVPQIPRAISSRRESARRRAEALARAQRELETLRSRVDAQATELHARDEELDRHQEQIRSLEEVVESLRDEISASSHAGNGAGSHEQITSLLASEGPDEEVAPAGDATARHLATRTDRELAEIFDTALRTWAIRDRIGAYEEADDWRLLGLATVHEASTRPAFDGSAGRIKRLLRGRPKRRLAHACAAHRLRS
jgi:hypothetical protein